MKRNERIRFYEAYKLRPESAELVALDGDIIEDRVEHRWFSFDISRRDLRELMRRSDGPGLANFGLWLALLAGSGYLAALFWGSWWGVPAFLLYGTIYSSSDARWHECGHGTCFKTRWINEIFYHLSSFMTPREAYLWRWSHARHHTYTNWVGLDEEIQVMRPAHVAVILADFIWLVAGYKEVEKVVLHAFGAITYNADILVPKAERRKMIWSSRAYLAIVLAVAGWSAAIGSFLPIMFVWLPRFYGGWLHQIFSLTQHAGLAENVLDHRIVARSVYLNPVYRFLYMNMNYHIEHHVFPMVPFFALPKLHEKIKDQMPPPYRGVIDAYREIVPAILRQARDPTHFVRRTVPGIKSEAA